MDYVTDFEITTEDDEYYVAQVKDPEAVAIEEGEIVDTKVSFEGAESDSISSFTDFVDNFISGTKVGRWFKNFKAGCQFILHMGSLVNDCVSDNPDLPLAASQGKVLMDLITQANADISQVKSDLTKLDTYSFMYATENYSGDADDLRWGCYRVTSGMGNAPIDNFTGGFLLSFRGPSEERLQVCSEYNGSTIYYRIYWGSTWRGWKAISSST